MKQLIRVLELPFTINFLDSYKIVGCASSRRGSYATFYIKTERGVNRMDLLEVKIFQNFYGNGEVAVHALKTSDAFCPLKAEPCCRRWGVRSGKVRF